MLQMIFLAVGLCIVVLTLSFAFKKHARLILWSSAITLFVGTLLLVGIGVINPVGRDNADSTTFWGTFSMLILGAALAVCAETQKEKNKKEINDRQNSNTNEISVLNEHSARNNERVILPNVLNTELALEVFAKAMQAKYMTQEGSHYKWSKSKVLLAYMCGRIYCGDKPEYYDDEKKAVWKYGYSGFFPDSELNFLFQIEDLGQSRTNRKDCAVPIGFEEIDKFFE